MFCFIQTTMYISIPCLQLKSFIAFGLPIQPHAFLFMKLLKYWRNREMTEHYWFVYSTVSINSLLLQFFGSWEVAYFYADSQYLLLS